MGTYDNLDEAIAAAREVCAEAIEKAGSIGNWRGMGDAGCVYDSQNLLVWHGPTEFQR